MKIKSNVQTDNNVDGVDVSILPKLISLKANSSDLPTGSLDGNGLGKLTEIFFNEVEELVIFAFEGGEVSISATIL